MDITRKSLTVLLADDDAAAREALTVILARKYPEAVFFSAGDGSAALEQFRNCLPDIVISDVIMPEVNGIQLAREIMAIKDDTKLIVLTGLSDLTAFDAAALSGIRIDHTVLKPVDFRELFAAIDQCIAEIAGRKTGQGLAAHG